MHCLSLLLISSFCFTQILGHGRLMEPVNRGSAFRKGFNTTENWNDDGNYCGGFHAHFEVNNGKCGACGDDYSEKQPRANENGGTYGSGVIVKKYTEGQEFEAVVEITANHKGQFEFALCPLKSETDIETEECFDAHPIKLVDGSDKYVLESEERGEYKVKLVLPKGLTCEHCSLRWNYKAGNNWGVCEDGTEAIGCGNQETFRTCSDVSILSA